MPTEGVVAFWGVGLIAFPPMASLDDLERWRRAGLLDEGTVAKIVAFERSRAQERATARELAFEVLAYLGVALAAVGVFALIATSWDQLESWARIVAIGIPSALGFAVAGAMDRAPSAPLRRASHLALVVSAALAGGTVAVVANEAGASDRVVGVAGTGTALASALGAWAWRPSPLTILGVAGALAAFGVAAGAWLERSGPVDEGLGVLAGGLLGLVLAEIGLAVPKAVARPAFASACLAGSFIAGVQGSVLWAETLLIALAVAFLSWSAVRRSLALTAVATIGLFVGLVNIIFEYFEEELGAPVALILSGAVVLASVLLLARFFSTGTRPADLTDA